MKTLKNKNQTLAAMGAKGMWSLENQLLGKAVEVSESFESL